MKYIFAILVLVSHLPAMSYYIDARSSWEEIFKSGQAVYFFEENLGGIKLDNACLTETEVRTLQPMQYCPKLIPVKRGENKDKYINWECEKWAVGQYAYPRTYLKQVCAEFETLSDQNVICKREELVLTRVPDTIKVGIAIEDRGLVGYPYISKLYTFPKCSN